MSNIAEKIVDEDVDSIIEDIKDFSSILQGKRFLLIGGSGFLGTYFYKTLIALNEILPKPIKITIIDNMITGKNKIKNRNNNVKFLKADISQNLNIRGRIDYIIHAASIASPPIYRKFPLETIDVNYQGTRNVLELAKKGKTSSILYLSSSEIYGDPDVIPTPESYKGYVSCTGPRACYDESKRLAETICVIYHKKFGIPIKIARPFNIFGPYLSLDDGRVLPDFIKNAITKSKIIIHSNGTSTRSFCYVTDAIKAFFRILLLAPPGSIFNVGNNEEISINQVAAEIKKTIGKSVEVKYVASEDVDYVVDNPRRRCPDLTKITKNVGYVPTVRFTEGLRRLCNWYMNDLK